ncbi:MAG: hypothetical protein KI792_00190 [Alphaproteobacteria bacterium]|nr:hypothetical protein [Alphaproteobacteria bacterium SS10]
MLAVEVRNRLPADVWDSYTKICNIRNPWDKTVSQFHMDFRHLRDEEQDIIINAFREWLGNIEKVPTDRAMYFIRGEPVADFFIRYQQLHSDLEELARNLDLELDLENELPTAKTGFRAPSSLPFQEYYDDHCRSRVADAYSAEIEHFDWTFD